MRGLFLDIINLSAAASYMIAAVIVLRPVIKIPQKHKMPNVAACAYKACVSGELYKPGIPHTPGRGCNCGGGLRLSV